MYKNIRRAHFKILSGRINVAVLRNRLSIIWRNSKRTKTKLVYGKTMLFQLEPCADVIMSVPGGRSILVGGCGRPPVPKYRRRRGVDSQKMFFQRLPKTFRSIPYIFR